METLQRGAEVHLKKKYIHSNSEYKLLIHMQRLVRGGQTSGAGQTDVMSKLLTFKFSLYSEILEKGQKKIKYSFCNTSSFYM